MTHHEGMKTTLTRTDAPDAVVPRGPHRRRRRLPDTARDPLIAAGWAVPLAWSGTSGAAAAPWWALPVLVVCSCLPLVWRRRYPVAVAVATGTAALALAVVLGVGAPLPEALAAFAAGSAVLYRAPAALVGALSVPWILALFTLSAEQPGLLWGNPPQIVMIALTGVLPMLVGLLLRMRAERAGQRRSAERSRIQRERARERARIARDVHDIAGHHLSAIRLLAVGGRESLRGPQADPDRVLSAIADAAGRAVGELRELLEPLREERWDEPPPPEVRLADLPRLVEAVEGIGMAVDLVLPPGMDEQVHPQVAEGVYRIVQEALGNALRHSSARHVTVRLARQGTAGLLVSVVDDGIPPPGAVTGRDIAATGLGLRGMRERAEELGGRVEAGFGSGGGWRVRAVLPVAPVGNGRDART
ncbi:sensor histidine kinase [Nocardiopsis dassonvillei]|uniref:sensor histidine kinase n=1 Tax=Nocardiopsis dassonvillei TaxID=2014 RepID=UPI000A5B85E1|nr:histidine kinase [Nocardiopsis dassonvillei]